jgi:hypothetical protein
MSHAARARARQSLAGLWVLLLALAAAVPGASAQDTGTAISVVTRSTARLSAVRTVALFLQGNDPLAVRILEDSIAIHLERQGIGAVNRELVERAVGDQIARRRKEKLEGGMSALDVGKAVKAEAVVTGTVLFDPEERRSVVVRVVSFQLLDTDQGTLLVNAVLTYDQGGSSSDVAARIARMMKGGS